MAHIKLESIRCSTCRLFATLDENNHCEFCRLREARSLSASPVSEFIQAVIVTVLIGVMVAVAACLAAIE